MTKSTLQDAEIPLSTSPMTLKDSLLPMHFSKISWHFYTNRYPTRYIWLFFVWVRNLHCM